MLGKITVGTVWDKLPDDSIEVYIGRSSTNPSPLGNPFIINAVRTREEACGEYEEYLMKEMNQGNPVIIKELNRIATYVVEGHDVLLRCYCKGKQCHGDFLKQLIDEQILEYQARTQ